MCSSSTSPKIIEKYIMKVFCWYGPEISSEWPQSVTQICTKYTLTIKHQNVVIYRFLWELGKKRHNQPYFHEMSLLCLVDEMDIRAYSNQDTLPSGINIFYFIEKAYILQHLNF